MLFVYAFPIFLTSGTMMETSVLICTCYLTVSFIFKKKLKIKFNQYNTRNYILQMYHKVNNSVIQYRKTLNIITLIKLGCVAGLCLTQKYT